MFFFLSSCRPEEKLKLSNMREVFAFLCFFDIVTVAVPANFSLPWNKCLSGIKSVSSSIIGGIRLSKRFHRCRPNHCFVWRLQLKGHLQGLDRFCLQTLMTVFGNLPQSLSSYVCMRLWAWLSEASSPWSPRKSRSSAVASTQPLLE